MKPRGKAMTGLPAEIEMDFMHYMKAMIKK
jgi:hypothetical protein